MPVKYKKQIQEPSYWKVALEGCNHVAIMSHEQVHNALVGEVYDPYSNSYRSQIVCPKCSGAAGVPRPGDFCMDSVIHTAADVVPLFT